MRHVHQRNGRVMTSRFECLSAVLKERYSARRGSQYFSTVSWYRTTQNWTGSVLDVSTKMFALPDLCFLQDRGGSDLTVMKFRDIWVRDLTQRTGSNE